jgi:hypothetical protein
VSMDAIGIKEEKEEKIKVSHSKCGEKMSE